MLAASRRNATDSVKSAPARFPLSTVDTYDGAANYYYGLANLRGGHVADAIDGLELASQSAGYREAAWTELAKLWLASGDDRRALTYAGKALSAGPGNLDALGVRIVVARRQGGGRALLAGIAALEAADPLSQLARFERLLSRHAPDAGKRLLEGARSELPEQALFQLAAWYQAVGELDAARHVLEGIGDQPEALYWRASLSGLADASGAGGARGLDAAREAGLTEPEAVALVRRATALSPRMVFPFRPEVIAALERVVREHGDWKPHYYLALGYWATGRLAQAATLLTALGDTPEYAPFYAARAELPDRARNDRIADLERASALDPNEWRYGNLLAERRLDAGDAAGAVATAIAYHDRHPASYILGLTLVRAYEAAQRYQDADALLATLHVLPYEGAAEGHALYREAKLMLAVDAMRERRWEAARAFVAAARAWPERLGAGKPYDADVDERLEDWLLADVFARDGALPEARSIWTRLVSAQQQRGTMSDVLPLWALQRLGRGSEAATALAAWRAASPGSAAAAWAADPAQPIGAAAGTDGRVIAEWRRLPR
jgi:hypothetical protein